MKIQPIDIDPQILIEQVRTDSSKAVLNSRLRKLFDRPFLRISSTLPFLRISSTEKLVVGEATQFNSKGGDGGTEIEPSSVCLAKMVQNFIEESNEKQTSASVAAKCGRNRCNCFNANSNDGSDDDFDDFGCFGESGSSGGDASDILKSLITCASVIERNVLADTAKIVEKNNKIHKHKDDLRKLVADSLSSLGYDSSICKSKWDKSTSFPAGEYQYIDVIVEGERLLIDIDFRPEFEIARSTNTYKVILQSLPYIFVGKSNRLGQIVSIVSEAARQSLKKKGMHFPPWRKAEYMRAKWLSPAHTRTSKPNPSKHDPKPEFELIFADESTHSDTDPGGTEFSLSEKNSDEKEKVTEMVTSWHPPAIKPRSVEARGAKIVTGLTSILKE